jgi:hypothetical protein
MSIHSRPVPAPKTPSHAASNPTTYLSRPEPHPTPQPIGRRLSESDPHAEPSRAAESRAEIAASDGTSRPWYRSEPWLAVMLAAFVPLVAAVVAPDAAQYPLIGLSVLALIVGAVMLIRHGVFRPHPAARLYRE